MICPDRCTMELIGTYRGIKINEVYRCKHCTVTSYRSVEMDSEKLIAELERVRKACSDLLEYAMHASLESGYCMCGDSMESHSGMDHAPVDAGEYGLGQVIEQAQAALASPAAMQARSAPATEPDPLTILAERQEPLGAEFAQVLHDNLDHLYVTAPTTEPCKPVCDCIEQIDGFYTARCECRNSGDYRDAILWCEEANRAAPATETAIPARRTFTDLDAERVARAFWRRIQPYVAEREYERELPYPCPVEFAAHMSTALLALDLPAPVAQSEQEKGND